MELRQEFSAVHTMRKYPNAPDSIRHVENSLPNNGKKLKHERGSYGNNVVHGDHNASMNHDHDHGDGDDVDVVMPVGFLDPLPPLERELMNKHIHMNNDINNNNNNNNVSNIKINVNGDIIKNSELNMSRRQFWKAGDYEGPEVGDHASTSSSYSVGGMEHVRVHPRFLHSNATSHKWVLGAFAELLDNSLDEVCNGATYVSVDMVINEKDRSNMLLSEKDRNRMLLIQDNGGGMNPDKMRQCMSLGYSLKSKMANTIGQYGNGFKTSTMRLGADVIVFSMCQGKEGTRATRSIGLLSYTFLTKTGKEDIIVPMVDYEKKGNTWTKMLRGSLNDWHTNLKTIIKWSPYSSEQELLEQFDSLVNQGTRIVIYNLWEDDEGQLELDFGSDSEDIQIRGVNRDEKKIALARKYPNSKHFLTYQHSLRSYASILYLRLPPGFRIILRGKDVVHHNLVNDMMHHKQNVYKPVAITDGTEKGLVAKAEDMQALVTIGFAKDAVDHMDIQGFNVYHKNRLIKPFWRVWNAAGSDGRGVIGVLEANFVEPAHDKQGFEKTTPLSRLEQRLIVLQKNYWRENCQVIGYAPRRSMNKGNSNTTKGSIESNKGNTIRKTSGNRIDEDNTCETTRSTTNNSVKNSDQSLPVIDYSSDEERINIHYESPSLKRKRYISVNDKTEQIDHNLHTSPDVKEELEKLGKENLELKNRLDDAYEARDHWLEELQLEKKRCKSLEAQLEEVNKKYAEMDAEQECLIQVFEEEKTRRNAEEENLRERLQAASTENDYLLAKVEALERMKLPGRKPEKF